MCVSSTLQMNNTRPSATTSCYPSMKKQRWTLQQVLLFWIGDRMQSLVSVSRDSCILPVEVF